MDKIMSKIADAFLMVVPSNSNRILLDEFNRLLEKITGNEIDVFQLPANLAVKTNTYLNSKHWISFHGAGVVSVYPMSTLERQQERTDVVFQVLEQQNIAVNNVVDFTDAELEGYFLEGLGSIVLDRIHGFAYASVSGKCDEELFVEFCEELEFTPIVFNASYSDGSEVLYTSSILKILDGLVLVAPSLIKDKKQRKLVLSELKKTGRVILTISEEQVRNYVADIAQVQNRKGENVILISSTSYANLTAEELSVLKRYGQLLVLDCLHIERWSHHSIGSLVNEVFK